MAEIIHPFYEAHRGAMEAAMHERLDLAEAMLRERAQLSEIDGIRQEVMDEFEIVLTQMPYVGGAASRMSDFFMRLMGFTAISRVLRRHGVPLPVIGEIERDTYKAQLLTVPKRSVSPRGVNSCRRRTRPCCASKRQKHSDSHQKEFPEDFAYDFVEPDTDDKFEFGINYKACGFCKLAARHGDKDILPNICGLDFVAYAARGIRLERTQTLAGGASHCNFRFSRLAPDERRRARPSSHALRLRVRLDCPCCHLVIASAAKQSKIFPRRQSGLLRCARNDGGWGAVRSRSTHTAMMTSCSCFARRVKRRCGRSSRNFGFCKSLNSLTVSTVHGVVFAFFVLRGGYSTAFSLSRCA